jgi:hypothetical protein
MKWVLVGFAIGNAIAAVLDVRARAWPALYLNLLAFVACVYEAARY